MSLRIFLLLLKRDIPGKFFKTVLLTGREAEDGVERDCRMRCR